MIVEVTQFNRNRNQFKLDEKLEKAMLVEEVKEFWDAQTVAERVDAFVDTEYVWNGTQIKYSYNGITLPDELNYYVGQSLHIMQGYLYEELGHSTDMIISKARTIVVNANAQKGSKLDENGKVTKKGFAINATEEIADMIAEVQKA